MPTNDSSHSHRIWSRLKPWLPNRIDRYIFTEILGPALGGILFFTFVFLLFQALRLSEFLITHRAFGWDLIELIGCITIVFLPAIVPIAFLIGVMVGFGRLSTDSELVAFKASGISIYRMSLSAIALSFLAIFLSLKLATQWSPKADRYQSEVISRIANRKIVRSIQAGTFQSDFFDLLMFAEQKDPKTDRLKNVFIFDERNQNDPLTIVAKEGEIISAISKSELGAAIILRLFDGNIHRTSQSSEQYQKVDFGEYRVYLEVEGAQGKAGFRTRFLTSKEIQQRLKEKGPSATTDQDRHELRVMTEELWKRYAIGFSPLVLCFLGVGFGTLRTRAIRSSATLIAFLIVLFYYGLLVAAQEVAPRFGLPPPLALNLPNLLGLLAGWRAIRSAAW